MTQDSERQPADTPKFRLFIAASLPGQIRRQLTELRHHLQTGVQFTSCRPMWTNPDTMHLTLIFLGQRPTDQLTSIAAAASEVTAAFQPLRLEIKNLGVFAHWRRPRVLWAGMRDRTRQIAELHDRLTVAMQPFDYSSEHRDYHPHLTLARFKSLKGTAQVQQIIASQKPFKFGPFDVHELTLFKSELHPDGARHTALHHLPFGSTTP